MDIPLAVWKVLSRVIMYLITCQICHTVHLKALSQSKTRVVVAYKFVVLNFVRLLSMSNTGIQECRIKCTVLF
uniref:Uncharacterized protein n=1 Tax=Anguilla anguilla TaxID=7936 RepID=A0A0E9XPP4_ANGAN